MCIRDRYTTGNVSLVARPADNVRLSVGPSFLRDVDPRGFVANVTDPAAVRFSGVRSVFAKVEQRTFGMTTRIDATFSPTLTLEMFAQPFIAEGRFDRYNEYAAPRTTDARYYGQDGSSIIQTRDSSGHVTHHRIDPDGDGPARAFTLANPDFNLRSLRGTAVVRWEYRPGSTLFVVWTQQRSGGQALGGFDLDADRRALFSDRPVNVFQVKASYWVGR